MIIVTASISVKPDRMSEFLDIFKSNVPKVLAEEGCIDYVPAIDLHSGIPQQSMDENLVTIVEKWESMQALQNHLASAHMQDYREKVQGLVSGATLKILTPA